MSLFGTFLKVPASMPTEILGTIGYDFVVVDEEHAAFNRETTDRIVLAARAYGLGAVVRVQNNDPSGILAALDCGADGVLVPHVKSAAVARAVVAAARYDGGHRGFSPSTRAGGFGAWGIAAHVAAEDARTIVIAMIEDPEGVEAIDDILAVDGIDAIFIGRGDLAVAYGDLDGEMGLVAKATDQVQAAARAAGKVVVILPGSAEDAAARAKAGATAFLVSSDQGFLRSAAMTAKDTMANAVSGVRGD
ncbi:aldolase/citrate lyase family protein [Rhodobacteraceae bacterium D3-12]|nr:aldolase/citrate lyase family protein [Rhodobacteraceae bacterium D3-12]